jgi:hypothetical protein
MVLYVKGSSRAISVIMATYQAGPYLEAQLASIFNQEPPPQEIVVSDDGSTDGTWQALQRLAQHSPAPIRLIRQPRNVGLRRNIEAALRAAAGEIIVLSDQDDVWLPGKIQAIASAFEAPNVKVWFSDAHLIDQTGRRIGLRAWQATNFRACDQDDVTTGRGLRRLLHGWTVTGATMAVRADILDLALPLPEEVAGKQPLYFHDGWMAVLGHLAGEVVAEQDPLVEYRQHPQQVTGMSMVAERLTAPAGRADRQSQLTLEMARISLVAERIRSIEKLDVSTDAMRELFELEAFLSVRLAVHNGRGVGRDIVRELSRGHYGKYTRGLRTAVWDLATPVRLKVADIKSRSRMFMRNKSS